MKNSIIFIFILFCLAFFSCRKKVEKQAVVMLGQLDVDLNANEDFIRTKEAPIGNLICDALKIELENKNITCDAIFFNAGGIRFDPKIRPDGIYKKGFLTSEMIDEMMPFTQNLLVKVKLTGHELKEILERSVAQLPLDKGAFFQFSDGIKITVDLNQQGQILDETVNPPQIVSEGNRITNVFINNVLLSETKIYDIITVDYIANGNDGYVTFLSIPQSNISKIEQEKTNLVKDYVTINSPIHPEIEGRINF
jgi:5'-nucleotidase/UDP-sugar diphosphatase